MMAPGTDPFGGSERVTTDEELAEWQAATPERRRLKWVRARPGRSVQAEGIYLVAIQDGKEIDHHPFLAGLMDLLESP